MALTAGLDQELKSGVASFSLPSLNRSRSKPAVADAIDRARRLFFFFFSSPAPRGQRRAAIAEGPASVRR